MPSDVRKAPVEDPLSSTTVIEPPSVKLIVRLFLIPLLIAAAVVGIMLPIGYLAGDSATIEQAMERLKSPGGERTLGLVGPASKQRYMDAKALVDHMKKGLTEPERIALATDLRDLLVHYTSPHEGDVQHFILLAMGRVWQLAPDESPGESPEAVDSRAKTMNLLVEYSDAPQVPARKAAILAVGYWKGLPETALAEQKLLEKLEADNEDVDVRIAAAAVLGNIASPDNERVIDALDAAMRQTDPRNLELTWNAALSLAQFNHEPAAGTVMNLLSRSELAQVQVFDREKDPKNPVFRKLNEPEQQRILINAMERARHLHVPEVQAQLRHIVESDPSRRVRAAGIEMGIK